MVLAPIAALCDVIENFGILAASSRAATDSIASWIRTPSLIKWGLLGIVWLILFRLYLPRNLNQGWRVVELATGILYAAGGLIAIWGVLAANRRIEQAVAPIAVATVMQLFVFLFDSGFLNSRYPAKAL